MTVVKARYAGQEKKLARGPRKPRKLLRRNDCFTADILGMLMLDVVKPRLKMPTNEALEKLATILEHWRGYYWRNQQIEPLEQSVAKYADGLLGVLIKLREKYDAINGQGENTARKIEAIDQARAALGQLFDVQIAINHSGKLTWHWLANALPADFAHAIKTTNQGYKIGIGHTGPLVRFIVAISPLLTGEQPPPKSVATQLKNFKAKHLLDGRFGAHIPLPPNKQPFDVEDVLGNVAWVIKEFNYYP